MKNTIKIRGLLAVAATAGLMAFSTAAKAEYPEKPVEMTVLFGGTANTIAQLLSELMSEELGQPVVPVARKGGGGAVGRRARLHGVHRGSERQGEQGKGGHHSQPRQPSSQA